MKKFAPLIAAALFAFAGGTAHASTLDIILGNAPNTFTFGSGGTLTPNINLHSPAPATLTLNDNSQIIGPPAVTSPNNFDRPTGSIFGNSYLAVLGTGDPGRATFTLGASESTFGFTWGTIDTFNTLRIRDSRGDLYTITGTEILTALGLPLSDSGKVLAQTDVIISDAFGNIIRAGFHSTKNSFEAANFYEGAVPLPAALPLFGAALLGLAFFARRRLAATKS